MGFAVGTGLTGAEVILQFWIDLHQFVDGLFRRIEAISTEQGRYQSLVLTEPVSRRTAIPGRVQREATSLHEQHELCLQCLTQSGSFSDVAYRESKGHAKGAFGKLAGVNWGAKLSAMRLHITHRLHLKMNSACVVYAGMYCIAIFIQHCHAIFIKVIGCRKA